MTGHGAVRGLEFLASERGDKDRGHHAQTAGSCGDQIRHVISVIIFQRKEHAAFRLHEPGKGIVNEGSAKGKSGLSKFSLPFLIVYLIENGLEPPIICL